MQPVINGKEGQPCLRCETVLSLRPMELGERSHLLVLAGLFIFSCVCVTFHLFVSVCLPYTVSTFITGNGCIHTGHPDSSYPFTPYLPFPPTSSSSFYLHKVYFYFLTSIFYFANKLFIHWVSHVEKPYNI